MKINETMIAIGAGLAAGLAVGVLTDRLVATIGGLPVAEWQNQAELMEENGYFVAEGSEVEPMETATPQVSPAFEKPDISKMVDYTKFSKEKEAEEIDGGSVPPAPVAEKITQEEFLRATGNEDGYVSVVGTWFEEDRILAGWNEELEIKDVEKNVGWDIISSFDDESVGAVYARNDHFRVLYEIVRGVGSYSDSVDEG